MLITLALGGGREVEAEVETDTSQELSLAEIESFKPSQRPCLRRIYNRVLGKVLFWSLHAQPPTLHKNINDNKAARAWKCRPEFIPDKGRNGCLSFEQFLPYSSLLSTFLWYSCLSLQRSLDYRRCLHGAQWQTANSKSPSPLEPSLTMAAESNATLEAEWSEIFTRSKENCDKLYVSWWVQEQSLHNTSLSPLFNYI